MASRVEQGGVTKLSKGSSAGQVYQGMSCENLVFRNIIANNIGSQQVLTITQNSQSLFLTTNLSQVARGTEDIYYVDDLNRLATLASNAAAYGLQTGDLAWVESEGDYYRWNGTSFVLYSPDTQFGTPGGPEFAIQFHTGSVGVTPGVFSGSANFTYDYNSNTARLTGSLNISGSLNASTNVNSNQSIVLSNTNNGSSAYTILTVNAGNGITGSTAAIVALPKDSVVNSYFAGGVNFSAYPISTGNSSRPVKHISSILNTTAISNFEWHYATNFFLGLTTKKMTLEVPSGILSNSGSIVTSGSLTIASGSANTANDTSFYFGNSGSNGSWRFNLTNGTMSLQAHNGTSYTTKQEWT